MEKYKPNSHKYKEEQKAAANEERKIDKVVSGKAKLKKKSGVRKLSEVFVSEDASSVKSYVLSDVIIPATKKLIFDIVRDGIEMFLYGTTGGKGRSSDRFGGNYVSYNKISANRDRRPGETSYGRGGFDYDDILFETRGDAEAVREQMMEVIERYGFVTIADMYDMAQLTAPYTSNKYGWTNIRNAEVVRARDGFIIKLPRAFQID